MRFSLLICFFCFACAAGAQGDASLRLFASIQQYDTAHHNRVAHRHEVPLHHAAFITTNNGKWQLSRQQVQAGKDATEFAVTFHLREGTAPNSAVSITLERQEWAIQNFVFTPGSTYNGNRFESRPIPYSPRLMHPADTGMNKPIIITDVPRLNLHDGPSRMQLTSGAMAYPLVGVWQPRNETAFFIETTQGNELGDYGIDVEENSSRTTARFSITAPHVREETRYRITNNRFPSTDKPAHLRAGDSVVIRYRVYHFAAHHLAAFFDRYFQLHQRLLAQLSFAPALPFSAAYDLIAEKYNRTNWNPLGFYAMDAVANNRQWKPGWVSGMPAAYALWFHQNAVTHQRLVQQNNWVLQNGRSPSGLFYERFIEGLGWIGGDHTKFHTRNWHLVRSSADALLYTLRLLTQVKTQAADSSQHYLPQWEASVRDICNRFVHIWQKNGQFGQFVHSETGDIIVGGSASGAHIPAALIQAAAYFSDTMYVATAKAAAQYFYQNFIQQGITTGGPGDALQNPDSESCYGLLESFMALYRHTGEPRWLQYAEETTKLLATWVMPYHYRFPDSTLMGTIGAQTGGTVWANTQNRHGAPGICTASGLPLLQLYQATGNTAYLQLLQAIAKTIPQYLSRPDRPIAGVPVGCMDERISTSDWYEGLGEITGLSTWAEVAMMLTAAELPGIYIRKTDQQLWVLDHVEAQLVQKGKTLQVHNPTAYPARIKVWVEPAGKKRVYHEQLITLAPGATGRMRL